MTQESPIDLGEMFPHSQSSPMASATTSIVALPTPGGAFEPYQFHRGTDPPAPGGRAINYATGPTCTNWRKRWADGTIRIHSTI